ncbi:cyclic nucleotide-binding domain-containing protein [Desulfobulbus alkaliphilus]|uniref:cyclic nucleotide-binding domain-containing protein n=1 Tax=Desulfobulbus alkaliphilus TaxID=869814 RepID=UPI001964C340|nr:cyclic nucleotide-binding domain-containing protein [Desulfobulbus alkaliphilus]MBM9536446.1 cyclic nucleotide-binding domain-containing protein [Desulfobulbus alkaliphilus]
MGFPKIDFRVCETRHCPLYRFGDVVQISGIAISMDNSDEHTFINTTVIHSPANRGHCKVLNGDLTRIIIEYERADQIPDCILSCSGCTGSIRIEHHRTTSTDGGANGANNRIGSMYHILREIPFFRNIDENNFSKVIKHFKLREYDKNDIILRKGDPGGYFFIIISGQVDILNDAALPISTLQRGEVFGEMSLICDENVGATVQARESCQLLSIDHKHFNSLLKKYPTLHMFFTRLLARRLTDSNKIRSDDYASGMIGKLEEIPPEALLQTLNVNSKTGILTITQLTKGTARFSFRQGSLIKASYGGIKGESAFYEVLKEKKGRFKFTPGLPPEDFEIPEIGYFMKLLMEGLQRMDERIVQRSP